MESWKSRLYLFLDDDSFKLIIKNDAFNFLGNRKAYIESDRVRKNYLNFNIKFLAI